MFLISILGFLWQMNIDSQREKIIKYQKERVAKLINSGAVVVAQLVEWSLQTPEIHGLNPNINKVLSTNCN